MKISVTRKSFRKTINDPKLFSKLVTFGDGHKVEAVYEDSLSSGSSIGTVVGFHGAPGSHNDFKYIRQNLEGFGIRFIGLNYPGFSHTKGYAGQGFDNVERQMYTDALLEKLDIPGRIVYMGHSRGCENALQTAVENNAHGLVLINPVGFQPVRSIPSASFIGQGLKLIDLLPSYIVNPIAYQIYKSLGFRVHHGEECISGLRTMVHLMLADAIPHIEKFNTLNTKVLLLYGGKDKLLAAEDIFEVLEKYKGLEDFRFEGEPDNEEVSKTFLNSGKGASVLVQKDNHFQNKARADLISTSLYTMLSLTEDEKT